MSGINSMFVVARPRIFAGLEIEQKILDAATNEGHLKAKIRAEGKKENEMMAKVHGRV